MDASGNGFYYLGSLTYVKNSAGIQLEGAITSSGRVLVGTGSRTGNDIRYFLTDHLGSVRSIVDQTGTVKERNDYYPFGTRYSQSGGNVDPTNRLKYNGKEDQTTGNLGYLDYGARMYDAELGRWFSVDPMAESYYSLSSYNYCANSPVLFIDPDGQASDWYQNGDGKALLWRDSKASELEINGEAYHNIGSNVSINMGDMYLNYYQNIPVSTSSLPVNALSSILRDPALSSKLLSVNSPLSDTYKNEILVNSMHRAQSNFLNHPMTQAAINSLLFVGTGGIEGMMALSGIGKNLITNGLKNITTSDGFLIGGINIRAPFNIPVQRFGQMNINMPDFWGVRIGSNSFINRTFAAIKPNWNPLNQYTIGTIPKGTPVRFGIIGPQGLKYPGGSLQFILDSKNVINQTSKLIKR
ncbi:RHS repeat-associated core domain-containing protein [uncultured Sanguibacteroides sp.]|uniref:RHS repeat domain-containing protein n=1 Tax=uncultured Sanguibacteroides sp. TaxID=1635151 RepID=UPI0025ED5DCF|nr:RHS repeat-associated core domain-containing protein [uncultured Sanguibacteroides sp.]